MNRRPTAREVQQALGAELLQELRYLNGHLTEHAERLGVGVVNHVLEVATKKFDATGFIALEFGVPIGSIEVLNHGANTVTVAPGGPGSSVPLVGIGVGVVLTQTTRTININNHQVVLWGTADQPVSYQVYTTGYRPGAGR